MLTSSNLNLGGFTGYFLTLLFLALCMAIGLFWAFRKIRRAFKPDTKDVDLTPLETKSNNLPTFQNPPPPPDKKPGYKHPKAIVMTDSARDVAIVPEEVWGREWVKQEIDALIRYYSANGPLLEHSLAILLKSFTYPYPSKPIFNSRQQSQWDTFMDTLDLAIQTSSKIQHHPNSREIAIFLEAMKDRLESSYIPHPSKTGSQNVG